MAGSENRAHIEGSLKKIIVLDRFRDACPRHHIGLPTGEVGKAEVRGDRDDEELLPSYPYLAGRLTNGATFTRRTDSRSRRNRRTGISAGERAAKFGGVHPLGLRQINFDLMDEVLPGLNNVARHIRPFVVIAWAWRRASQLAEASRKKTIPPELLQDFVDRIEVHLCLVAVVEKSKGRFAGPPGHGRSPENARMEVRRRGVAATAKNPSKLNCAVGSDQLRSRPEDAGAGPAAPHVPGDPDSDGRSKTGARRLRSADGEAS